MPKTFREWLAENQQEASSVAFNQYREEQAKEAEKAAPQPVRRSRKAAPEPEAE